MGNGENFKNILNVKKKLRSDSKTYGSSYAIKRKLAFYMKNI